MSEFKGSKKEWHVVEFAGHYHIMDEPYYNAKDLLDEDDYKDLAKYNAQLAAASPELLEALQNVRQFIDNIQVSCAAGEYQLAFLKATSDSAINKALNI